MQFVLVKIMYQQREKGVKITDQRMRLTTEVCAFPQPVDSFLFTLSRSYKEYGLSNYTHGNLSMGTRWGIWGRGRSTPSRKCRESYNSTSASYHKYAISHCGRMARAAMIAFITFTPILATTLSFVGSHKPELQIFAHVAWKQITYALSGHDLNVAIIFTSLQFFNVDTFTSDCRPER